MLAHMDQRHLVTHGGHLHCLEHQKHLALTVEHCKWKALANPGLADMAHRHLWLMQVHYLPCQKHVALLVEDLGPMAWIDLLDGMDQRHLGLMHVHYLPCQKHLALTVGYCDWLA